MSQVHMLYQLQQIDTEIREKKQRLGEVLKARKETEELLAARRRVETAVAELQQWRTQHTDLSLELDTLNNKAKRSENRLYSGNVTNPKELTDLQNQIASLGRRRGVLEDEVLEAMIMIEDAEAEKTAADEALLRIGAKWEQDQAALKQEQNELALSLHALAGSRKKQVSLIPATALSEYESLSRRKKGLAVVRLKNNICLGCQLNVSANTGKEVSQGKQVYCAHCGRILYAIA